MSHIKINSNNNLNFNTIIKRTIATGAVMSIFSLLTDNPVSFIYGLIFGLVISILNFRLLYLTLNNASKMPPAKAQKYVTIRYFIRYIIVGLAIYVSIINKSVNVIGTIIGFVIIKIVILVSNALNKRL